MWLMRTTSFEAKSLPSNVFFTSSITLTDKKLMFAKTDFCKIIMFAKMCFATDDVCKK